MTMTKMPKFDKHPAPGTRHPAPGTHWAMKIISRNRLTPFTHWVNLAKQ